MHLYIEVSVKYILRNVISRWVYVFEFSNFRITFQKFSPNFTFLGNVWSGLFFFTLIDTILLHIFDLCLCGKWKMASHYLFNLHVIMQKIEYVFISLISIYLCFYLLQWTTSSCCACFSLAFWSLLSLSYWFILFYNKEIRLLSIICAFHVYLLMWLINYLLCRKILNYKSQICHQSSPLLLLAVYVFFLKVWFYSMFI